MIFDHAIPSPSYSGYRKRHRTLLALSRTSRHFHQLAQPILLKHVTLPDLQAAELFLDSVRRKPATADAVRVLRLGTKRGQPAWAECFAVGRLLEVCTGVEELWLLGMSTIHLEDIWKGKSECSLLLPLMIDPS